MAVEQYVIDIEPTHLLIVGGKRPPRLGEVSTRGTLYGVYDLLEQLGVRWYRPEPWGTFIPDTPNPELPVGKTTSKVPDFEMHSAVGCGMERYRQPVPEDIQQDVRLWASRNRLNWNETGGARKFGGQVHFSFEHSYHLYFPPAKYFASHPEYFPLIDGQRTPVGQLCIGNPELQNLFAEKIIARGEGASGNVEHYRRPQRRRWLVPVPTLPRMDDPAHPTVMSNRIATFNNIIARKLAAAVPGMRIHWLAYSEGTQAPTIVKQLEPNTIIQLSTINEWGDYTKNLFDSSSLENSNFLQDLKDWYQLKPSAIMTYEYWTGGYAWPGPLPLVHTVADRLRNYRQFHVTGIYSEGEPQWGPQGMNYYFIAKLLWNPDLDVEKEMDLYYKNYYGPAARQMKEYNEVLERAFDAASPGVYSGGRGMHFIFKPSLVSALGVYMNQAVELAKGQDPYERRLHGAWAGYEFAKMISQVLVTKKHEGTLVLRNDSRGSYYRSEKAARQYDDAVKFLLSFYKGDAVFDINLTPPDYGSLTYLRKDVLENDAFPFVREDQVLQDF